MKNLIKKFSLSSYFQKNYPFFTNQKATKASGIFQKYFLKHSFGFTLVELIVVITILAILGTIAFVSFNDYTKGARDSTRLSDLAVISKGLLMYKAKIDKYPLPDKSVKIYGSGELVGYQGEAGITTANIINLSSQGGKDPLYKTNYTYTITALFDKYQLLTFLEDKSSITLNLEIPQNIKTYATDYIDKYPYVRGDTLGTIINYSTGSKNEPIYTPLQDTGTGINLESPAINQKVITNNTTTLTGVTIDIKNNYIQTPSSVNGACGTKAKTYEKIETAFSGSDTDCVAGSLSGTVLWPAIGATTTWNCNGFSGGTNTTCTAIHSDKGCATNPAFANIGTLTTGTPTSSGQTWIYSTTPTGNCTYTCTNGYSGNNCTTPPPAYYPSLCDSPDIVKGSYTIAACNVGTTTAGTGFASYGVYFQWGEMYGWNTTAGITSANNIKYFNGAGTTGSLSTWSSTVIDTQAGGIDRWGTTGSKQGPCPYGRHVPTQSEWAGIAGTYGGDAIAMSTNLKLPLAAYRDYSGGSIGTFGNFGYYWSSTANDIKSYELCITAGGSIFSADSYIRPYGFSVRCFKN